MAQSRSMKLPAADERLSEPSKLILTVSVEEGATLQNGWW